MTYAETNQQAAQAFQRAAQGYFDLVSHAWEESRKLVQLAVEAGIENMKDSLRAATDVQERLIEVGKEARESAAQGMPLQASEATREPVAFFQKATALCAEGAQKVASVGLANAKTLLGLAEASQARLFRVNQEAAHSVTNLAAKAQGIFSIPQSN